MRTLKLHLQCQTTNKGYTLIEVLIALFIGSLVLVTLYASFFQIIKSKEITESELELYHEANVIISNISDDLASIYDRGNLYLDSPGYIAPVPQFEADLQGENSFIRFASLCRDPGINERDSDQALISYFVQQDEDTGLYRLYRSENPFFEEDSNIVSYAISERVILFRLNYMDGLVIDDQNYSESWNSNERGNIPNIVELLLVLKSPRDENVEFRALIKLRQDK